MRVMTRKEKLESMLRIDELSKLKDQDNQTVLNSRKKIISISENETQDFLKQKPKLPSTTEK